MIRAEDHQNSDNSGIELATQAVRSSEQKSQRPSLLSDNLQANTGARSATTPAAMMKLKRSGGV